MYLGGSRFTSHVAVLAPYVKWYVKLLAPSGPPSPIYVAQQIPLIGSVMAFVCLSCSALPVLESLKKS